jgi:nicotinamide-nucleotide amidase
VPTVSLLAIGNELLNGAVRDKNLFTLIQQMTHLGFSVECAAIVRDAPDKIAIALHFILAQEPEVLICSGGLGPTEDDLTLAALADTLDLPLTFNVVASELVEMHYDHLITQQYLTQRGPEAARRKMATLPEGAYPLYNPIGTAPGVRLEYCGTLIYVLPGVPSELEAIFDEVIVLELQQRFHTATWAEGALMVYCNDEAEIAEVLRYVTRRHPEIYIKSLAQPFPAATEGGLRVIATAQAASASLAREAITRALADLQQALEAIGLRVAVDVGS